MDRTFVTILVDGKLIYSGSNFQGYGPFKALIKLDEVLPQKADCTLTVYANVIKNGHHYISVPKVLDIIKGVAYLVERK